MFATLAKTLVLTVFLALAGAVSAQVTQDDRDRYDAWLALADRAEQVIDTAKASNTSLEQLRAEIVDYRDFFAGIRDQNSARIATLQAQLEALGPKPDSGDEPEDIANLRANLSDQLDELRVPRVVSEEAHSRAGGLISEVDQIIRDRQTRRLFSRGPSPLNPEYWPLAWRDFKNASVGMFNETARNWGAEATREKIRQALPMILVLAALGLLLVVRGRRWSEKLGDYMRRFGGRGSGVWTFVVSLARIALPLAGTILIVSAIDLTGVLGLRGALVFASVPAWALTFLAFNWLAYQLYGPNRRIDVLFAPSDRRAEMIFYVQLLAVTLILRDAINLYEDIENLTDASRAVVAFPIILAAGLILLRLYRVGFKDKDSDGEEEKVRLRSPGVYRIVGAIRRMAILLAIVAPVLAGLGYVAAAEALIFPVLLTLAIVATVLILQRFLSDLMAWLLKSGETSAGDTLFSVLVGFALTLGAVPLVALAWGARSADITELWTKFLDGFQIGDAQISPTGFLTFAIVFVGGYSVTRLLQSGLRTNLLPKTKIDPGGQNAIVAFTGYLGLMLAALIAVSSAGLDLSSVAIVAGALSVGIGFGLQTIVSNFVSGIILLIERPIAKGDWIEVGGFAGYVRDISVRSTRIETFDKADVIVPNSDLIAGTVINYTRGNTVGRIILQVGVAYGTDTRMVEKLLLEIANAHPMVLAHPAPGIVFRGFGADSLDFEVRAILRDVNWGMSVRSDLNHEIAKRFVEEGIEIPFAQRDVWLRNPETLAQAAPTQQE
jgi:potassium-dependent mechanosensitive channel